MAKKDTTAKSDAGASKGASANAQATSDRQLVVHAQYVKDCLLYTSPSPRARQKSRMPSSA